MESELDSDIWNLICQNLSLKDICSLEEVSKDLNLYVKDIYKNGRMITRGIPPTISKEIANWVWSYDNLDELYENVKLNLNLASLFTKMPELKNKPNCDDLNICIDRFHHERTTRATGLTHEQKAIAEYKPQNGETVLVQAFAGTGKTTTLVHFAENNPESKILYIAFNTNLAKDARDKAFVNAPHVTCTTIHSLALNRLKYTEATIKDLSLHLISKTLDISIKDASIVRKIMTNFFPSQDYRPCIHHGPINIMNADHYIDLANLLWNQMPNVHDGYLKEWQLKKEKLEFDVIFLDECQDATPAILDIVFNQKHAVKILVGDTHQQIYGFRKVCNPFEEKLPGKVSKFCLSYTFRFGHELATLCSRFLNTYKKTNLLNITSAQQEHTKISFMSPYTPGRNYDITEKKVIITRTVKECFSLAFCYARNRNVKIHIIGETIDFDYEILCLLSMSNLYNNNDSDLVEDLQGFDSFSDAIQFWCSDIGDKYWKLRLDLFNKYNIQDICNFWSFLKFCWSNESEADIIITTAHKAKGLEFDNVELANDFVQLIKYQNSVTKRCLIHTIVNDDVNEGYNILYVAMTRAKKLLILNKELFYFREIYRGGMRKWEKELEHSEACVQCGNQTTRMERIEYLPVGRARCQSCSNNDRG